MLLILLPLTSLTLAVVIVAPLALAFALASASFNTSVIIAKTNNKKHNNYKHTQRSNIVFFSHLRFVGGVVDGGTAKQNLKSQAGILRSAGNFPDILSRQILVGIILVGRWGKQWFNINWDNISVEMILVGDPQVANVELRMLFMQKAGGCVGMHLCVHIVL